MSSEHSKIVIAIVDDDEDFIVIVRKLIAKLTNDGCVEIKEFYSPGKAITAIAVEGFRPDLIITDLIFPGAITGLDVMNSAKSRGIPCILCSTLPSDFLWSKTTSLVGKDDMPSVMARFLTDYPYCVA